MNPSDRHLKRQGMEIKVFYFHISGWGLRAIYHSDIFEKLRPPPCTVTADQYLVFVSMPPLLSQKSYSLTLFHTKKIKIETSVKKLKILNYELS